MGVKKKLKMEEKKAVKKANDVDKMKVKEKSPAELKAKYQTMKKKVKKLKKSAVKNAKKALKASSARKEKKYSKKAEKMEAKKKDAKKKVKQIEKNLSKGRQEIVTALARMREILTSKAMQFVQNYGLDLKGRDGNLASFADQVETKWIKLYKRTMNGAPIPPLTFGDGEKQHRAFKKQSKKLLKSYIKHKLGQKLKPIITVEQRDGGGVTGREIELGSLWGDIMGDSEGSESAVGAEKKKTKKNTEAWKKATDEFM